MEILRKQKAQGKTILIVHHDLHSVEEYFDWTILLNTRLVGCGPTQEIFTKEMLAKAFGKNDHLFSEAVGLTAKNLDGHA